MRPMSNPHERDEAKGKPRRAGENAHGTVILNDCDHNSQRCDSAEAPNG